MPTRRAPGRGAVVKGLAVLEPAAVAGFHGAALDLDDQHAALGIDEEEVPLPLGAGVVVDAQGVPGEPAGGQAGLQGFVDAVFGVGFGGAGLLAGVAVGVDHWMGFDQPGSRIRNERWRRGRVGLWARRGVNGRD